MDAPISVQWIVLYCPLTDWLSGSVVYAQIYELRVVSSNRGSTMLWRFFAISPLVELLIQQNGSIVIAIVIGGGGGGGGGLYPPLQSRMTSAVTDRGPAGPGFGGGMM